MIKKITNKFFGRNLKDLSALQSFISSVLVLLSVSAIITASTVFTFIYLNYKSQEKAATIDLINSANGILAANVSEQLSVIINTQDFVNYLRSGDVSRKQNYADIGWLFSNLNQRLITGALVTKENKIPLFFYGTKDKAYITLSLCYLNGHLNAQGQCDYQLTLYFNSENYLQSLNRINSHIEFCKTDSCIYYNPFALKEFGSFPVQSSKNMELQLKYVQPQSHALFLALFVFIIFTLTLLLLSQFIVKKLIKRYLINPVRIIQENLGNRDHDVPEKYFLYEFSSLSKTIKNYQEQQINIELNKTAAQTAHDIRSPLATINAIVKETHEIEEQKRIILRNATQQLNDIANVLLLKYRSKVDGASSECNSVRDSEVIAVLLDLIVSEKRLQYKHLPLTIDFNMAMDARGAFAQIVVSDFKRVISNIINNAVEAINGKGEIRIILFASETTVNIEISDSGIGMPPELIAKVFDGSIISNKKEGSGIGLVSAYQLIKSWGGNLRITSQLNVGTTIHLSFVLLEPAPWFAANLNFIEDSQVVILDDDQSIHDLWESRFSCEIPHASLQLRHFYQADELIQTNKSELKSACFLCDYELIGQNKTGLDVIEQMNLGGSAILVTSRYDDREVRRRCAELDIKILPKNYAAYAPIYITKKKSNSSLLEVNKPDFVLIDNDHLIINAWKFMGKKKGKTFLAFDNFADAEKVIEKLSRTIPVYIDSDLGTEIPGEECAKILYKKGFVNIYLATGHSAARFKSMNWIKGIVGKEPPF